MSEQSVKRRPMIDLEEFERRLRQPLAASPREDDPLAELARSFGGDEVDPYKTVFEPLSRRPSGSWRSEVDRGEGKAQGVRRPLIGDDFAAIEAGLLGTARHDNEGNLFDSDEIENYPPQDGQEHWSYADAEGSREPEPAYEDVRSRRPLYVMAAMIVAGLFGIGASFGFKGAVSNPTEIVTIKAADGPAKIHPDTVANTDVPDRDASVLGGTPQQPPVAAVDNVEQPADLSAQADAQQFHDTTAAASGAASVPLPPPPSVAQAQVPAPAQVQPQSTEPLSIAALIEPKKVKTVSVRPDGTLLPNTTPAMVASPPPSSVSSGKPATPKSGGHIAAAPKPASGATVVAKAQRTQVADAQGGVPAAETAAAPAAASGSFSVQLAAPGTEQEARITQVRIMKKFGTELAGFHPSIHKAEVGGKPVYRVRVSGLSSRDEAAALCQKLQTGGGHCFVAKN
jgi:SPOR domain